MKDVRTVRLDKRSSQR